MNERTDVSYLIEQFIVEPNVAGLRKALREMSDGYYNCEPNVFTATEARRRLRRSFLRAYLDFGPICSAGIL